MNNKDNPFTWEIPRVLEFPSQESKTKTSQIFNIQQVLINCPRFPTSKIFLLCPPHPSFFLHPCEFTPLKKNHFTEVSGGFLEEVQLDACVHSTILNSIRHVLSQEF